MRGQGSNKAVPCYTFAAAATLYYFLFSTITSLAGGDSTNWPCINSCSQASQWCSDRCAPQTSTKDSCYRGCQAWINTCIDNCGTPKPLVPPKPPVPTSPTPASPVSPPPAQSEKPPTYYPYPPFVLPQPVYPPYSPPRPTPVVSPKPPIYYPFPPPPVYYMPYPPPYAPPSNTDD